jgi:hypothetical protein
VVRAPSNAGFFSSAKRLELPLGRAIDARAVKGYPIDLSVKAQSRAWPPQGMASASEDYVFLAQHGLGCFERYLAGDGGEWLDAALRVGAHLLETQQPDGSWLNTQPLRHTFPLKAPWRCGMAHGQAASLLVRLHLQTSEVAFAEAARRGLAPLSRPLSEGGVCASLGGDPWPEEYPTEPPSFVLNGAIFAWWGMRDVGVGLDDPAAMRQFDTGLDTLVQNLPRFDTGSWSLYSLYPHPVPPVASSFYHALHITQLEAMNILSPHPELSAVSERWRGYMSSTRLRRGAFARKALFRLLVPRNRLLAERLPWSRPRCEPSRTIRGLAAEVDRLARVQAQIVLQRRGQASYEIGHRHLEPCALQAGRVVAAV